MSKEIKHFVGEVI